MLPPPFCLEPSPFIAEPLSSNTVGEPNIRLGDGNFQDDFICWDTSSTSRHAFLDSSSKHPHLRCQGLCTQPDFRSNYCKLSNTSIFDVKERNVLCIRSA